MNCKDVTEVLDRMVFEDVRPDENLLQHIESCPDCSEAYRRTLEARGILNFLRTTEPTLDEPEQVMENIMSSISHGIPGRSGSTVFLLQRLLAAASIAVFLLFGYEQAVVVSKIARLEATISNISADPRSSYPLRLYSAQDIMKAGISVSDIERLMPREKGRASMPFISLKNHFDLKTIK